MQAVVIREHGAYDHLLLEDQREVDPGPGEVRLVVHAAGVNHLDIWVRRGVDGARFPLPIVPGSDASGVVDAVGPGVDHLTPGDPVVLAPGLGCGRCRRCLQGEDPLCNNFQIFGESRDGTCREKIVVPARSALPKPAGLSFPEAASFALTFLTAYHMVVTRARLQPHETILIHAAGSGVSVAAIQIARRVGARVLVTAGSHEKLARARALGAEHGIHYREVDFAREVRKYTAKAGVDVVIDHVGKDTLDASIRCLAKGGRLVTCGGTSGPEFQTDIRHIFFKGLSVLGSTMGSLAEMVTLLDEFARGVYQPVVDRILPLSQVAEAHRLLQEREVTGKVVLVPDALYGAETGDEDRDHG